MLSFLRGALKNLRNLGHVPKFDNPPSLVRKSNSGKVWIHRKPPSPATVGTFVYLKVWKQLYKNSFKPTCLIFPKKVLFLS